MSDRDLTKSPPPPIEALDRFAEAVDEAVPDADTVGNKVLVDNSRTVRWGGTLFVVCAAVLIPWTVFVAVSLPQREVSPNYGLAWSGFDVLLLVALACTAWSALRRSRYLAIAGSWTAAMLVVDAWFDVTTSPGRTDLLIAVGLAAAVELPLAAACLWMSVHAQDIADARLRLVLRRVAGRRPAEPAPVEPTGP